MERNFTEELFAPVEFPYEINLPPRSLGKGLYATLEKTAVRELSGTCRPHIGYVKPGTVQIVKKTLGQIKGSHCTGSISYSLQIRCQATMPVAGQRIICSVFSKNDAGIMAKNFQLPYTLFIPKMPGSEDVEILDRLQPQMDIEVEVQIARLKAASRSVPKTEYWVICKLINTEIGDNRHTVMPSVDRRPELGAGGNVTVAELDRETFTGGAYQRMKQVSKRIEDVTETYLALLGEHSLEDPVLLAEVAYREKQGRGDADYGSQRPFAAGKIVEVTGRDTYTLKVVCSNLTEYKPGDNIYVERKLERQAQVGEYMVYYKMDAPAKKIDFWGLHAKYYINPYELIKPPKDYRNQLNFISHELGTKEHKYYDSKRPVSRSYFKFREIYREYPDVIPEGQARVLCIAESPGGFVQAVVDVLDTQTRHTVDAMSITSEDNKGTWALLQQKLRDVESAQVRANKSVPLTEKSILVNLIGDFDPRHKGGKRDQDGDILYNGMENVDRLVNGEFYEPYDAEHKADLVTADGGFYHDKTESSQELLMGQLIIAELITALRTQKQGGTFILKIYDMATEFTAGILTILSYCYSSVNLFKPVTSRRASSEKYLVCRKFKVEQEDLDYLITELQKVLQQMGTFPEGQHMKSILLGIPEDTKAAIIHYNGKFMLQQMNTINEGVVYSNMYFDKIRSGKRKDLQTAINARANMQEQAAQIFLDMHNITH